LNKLFYGDNLDILRRYIKDESVDLVYLKTLRAALAMEAGTAKHIYTTEGLLNAAY
jgi:hypothetical protein